MTDRRASESRPVRDTLVTGFPSHEEAGELSICRSHRKYVVRGEVTSRAQFIAEFGAEETEKMELSQLQVLFPDFDAALRWILWEIPEFAVLESGHSRR